MVKAIAEYVEVEVRIDIKNSEKLTHYDTAAIISLLSVPQIRPLPDVCLL